jgi:hypothetical protein
MAKSKAKPKNDLIIPKDFPTSLKPITDDRPPDIRSISVIIEGSSPLVMPSNSRGCGCCR